MTVTSNLKAVIGEKAKGSAYRIRVYHEGMTPGEVKVDKTEVIPSKSDATAPKDEKSQ